MTSLALLGQSLALIAVFFGCATLVFLVALVLQPASERSNHAIDAEREPSWKEGAAPSQAPLQRVDQVVDLARGAGLRDEASGFQNGAAVGVR